MCLCTGHLVATSIATLLTCKGDQEAEWADHVTMMVMIGDDDGDLPVFFLYLPCKRIMLIFVIV